MLMVRKENGIAVEVRNLGEVASADLPKWESRWEWKSWLDAAKVANELNLACGEVGRYVPTDAGPCVSPRYDVIEAPRVGDEISYAYNGDYYPDGEIVKISGSKRIVYSSTGNKYWRRKNSGAWLKGGMWCLVPGHISERNPHL